MGFSSTPVPPGPPAWTPSNAFPSVWSMEQTHIPPPSVWPYALPVGPPPSPSPKPPPTHAERISHHLRESSLKTGRGQSVSPHRSESVAVSLPVDSHLVRQAVNVPVSRIPTDDFPPGFVPYSHPPSCHPSSHAPQVAFRPRVISPKAHRLARISASIDDPLVQTLDIAACSPPEEWNRTLPAPPPTRKDAVGGRGRVESVRPALFAAFGEEDLAQLTVAGPVKVAGGSTGVFEPKRTPTRQQATLSTTSQTTLLRTGVQTAKKASPPLPSPPIPTVSSPSPPEARSPTPLRLDTPTAKSEKEQAYVQPAKEKLRERDRLRAVKGDRVKGWLSNDKAGDEGTSGDKETGLAASTPLVVVQSENVPSIVPADKSGPAKPAVAAPPPQPTATAPLRKTTPANSTSSLSSFFSAPTPATPPSTHVDKAITSASDPLVRVPTKFASRIAKSQVELEKAYKRDLERAEAKAVGSARGGKGGKVTDVAKVRSWIDIPFRSAR